MIKMCLLLLWFGTIEAFQKCCDGTDNRLVGRICADGSNITGITCLLKFLVNPNENENFTITSDDAIEFTTPEKEPMIFKTDRYCITKYDDFEKDVALICFEEFNWLPRGICFMISVVFLVLTIMVYMAVPSLRDLQGKCTLGAVSGLACAFFAFGLLYFVELKTPFCEIIAFAVYFFFMLAFFWLNLVSFHIWRTTILNFLYTNYRRPATIGTRRQWLRIYYSYGFGAPTILLIATLIAYFVPGDHLRPDIQQQKICWFDAKSKWAYFYGPIATLLILNTILFIWIMKILWKDIANQVNLPSNKVKCARYKCMLYLKMFFIMGLTWIFELLSDIFGSKNKYLDYFWTIVDYINAIQGLLIFVVLVVLRKRALRGLSNIKIGVIKFPKSWTSLKDEEEEDENLTAEQLRTNGIATEEYALNENRNINT